MIGIILSVASVLAGVAVVTLIYLALEGLLLGKK